MIDKFYLEDPEDAPKETPEETKARERRYLVAWMKRVMAEKPDAASRKAFLDKVHYVARYHGITYEELIEDIEQK